MPARLTPEKLAYTIKRHHRSRTLRLRVFHDGTITVTIPRRASLRQAEAFVRSKTDWLLQALSRMHLPPVEARIANHVAEYNNYKLDARRRIQELLDRYALQGGFSYRSVVIRNQRTCWGSCSRQKTLSFNYKILFLPVELQEYIVVHELCHLKEMNHSSKFWRLVESFLPDYVVRRKALRKIGIHRQ